MFDRYGKGIGKVTISEEDVAKLNEALRTRPKLGAADASPCPIKLTYTVPGPNVSLAITRVTYTCDRFSVVAAPGRAG